MKYALVDGNKVEAVKGAKALCPSCGAGVVSKCGEQKIHHWAHKGKRSCDPWWENETMWHRSWKSNFQDTWQEIPLKDEINGEIHIADVRTSDGLVIEFQHSFINPNERRSREEFYKNMTWVIDCTRLKKDYTRFINRLSSFQLTNRPGVFHVAFSEECFPKNWLGSRVPVIFDFKGTEMFENSKDLRQRLYCLLPNSNNHHATVLFLSRADFIESTINASWITFIRSFYQPHLPQPKQQSKSIQYLPRRRESPYYLERGKWKRRIRL